MPLLRKIVKENIHKVSEYTSGSATTPFKLIDSVSGYNAEFTNIPVMKGNATDLYFNSGVNFGGFAASDSFTIEINVGDSNRTSSFETITGHYATTLSLIWGFRVYFSTTNQMAMVYRQGADVNSTIGVNFTKGDIVSFMIDSTNLLIRGYLNGVQTTTAVITKRLNQHPVVADLTIPVFCRKNLSGATTYVEFSPASINRIRFYKNATKQGDFMAEGSGTQVRNLVDGTIQNINGTRTFLHNRTDNGVPMRGTFHVYYLTATPTIYKYVSTLIGSAPTITNYTYIGQFDFSFINKYNGQKLRLPNIQELKDCDINNRFYDVNGVQLSKSYNEIIALTDDYIRETHDATYLTSMFITNKYDRDIISDKAIIFDNKIMTTA